MRPLPRSALGLVAAALVVGWASLSPADDPVGRTLVFELSGEQSIWDPSEDLQAECDTICELEPGGGEICVEACISTSSVTDARGRVMGTATLDATATLDGAEILVIALAGTASGRIQQRRSLTRVVEKFRAEGIVTPVGSLADELPSFGAAASGRCSKEIDSTGDFAGTCSLRICLRPPADFRELRGCEKLDGIPDVGTLPSGDWTLTVDLVPGDREGRMGGTATAATSCGDFGYDVRGQYVEKRDESRISMKPDALSRGSKVSLRSLTTTGENVDAAALDARICGQRSRISSDDRSGGSSPTGAGPTAPNPSPFDGGNLQPPSNIENTIPITSPPSIPIIF
jgi:hypothetical protein